MAESKIEWTDRSDWNPIRGCTRVSPGCVNCYAEGIAARFSGAGQPFAGFARRVGGKPRWTGKVELVKERLLAPLSWRKAAMVFACSMSDLFHEALPDEAIDQVFAVMALSPHLTFQVLTKRPARMRAYFAGIPDAPNEPAARGAMIEGAAQAIHHQRTGEDPSLWLAVHTPLPNVWLGVSVEDQERADERIPDLLATPAARRFLSCEPLLGSLDLIKLRPDGPAFTLNALTGAGEHLLGMKGQTGKIDWVIAGGESGRDARPAHPAWFRGLRDQCGAAGVPYFHKQNGEWLHQPERAHFKELAKEPWQRVASAVDQVRPALMFKVGKKAAGALLDGREHREFPA